MKPLPIDLVIYKIVQRCNLDCSYCYVYNQGDSSWRDRPSISSYEVSSQLGESIKRHCQTHNRTRMTIELHGGEPLLIGKRKFVEHINLLRKTSSPIELDFCMQTNGLLLDSEWIEIFKTNSVVFSISLDGPPEIADKNRIYPNGSGSTLSLLKNILNLKEENPSFDDLCQGYLCVIDVNTDGSEIFNWFVDSGFNNFDFLIPDGNYMNPTVSENELIHLEEYLISAFDEWFNSKGKAPKIRLFELAVSSLFGSKYNVDAFGGDISGLCVVETNGAISSHDVIRMCLGEYSHDVLNVGTNELSDHQSFYKLDEIQKLNSKCRECKYLNTCGGGYLPHRYDGSTFDNPSYYCTTLFGFFSHVERKVRENMPEGSLRNA
jgi:uncharacterized protein